MPPNGVGRAAEAVSVEEMERHQKAARGIRITFGMIVLNGEPFVSYNLRALYPYAHQIIVVEGAAPAAKLVATPDGHSSDGTLATLRRFKAEEDPDDKLLIVTAEDEGHRDGFWIEKDEMSTAYASRSTGNYLWQIDADEFYLPEHIESVIDMLAEDPGITTVSFHLRTFWGNPSVVVDSFFLRRFVAHRLFAWGRGYRYADHRPPTVLDNQGRDLRSLKPVPASATRKKGIWLYHYELLFPKQVAEKAKYYSSVQWTTELRQADEWVRTCYTAITKPFRVHMAYTHLSWLEHFRGEQPPQVKLMMRAVDSGAHPGVRTRRTDDIQALLEGNLYAMTRLMLKCLIPMVDGLARAKARARRELAHTGLWRTLQATRRKLMKSGL